jgi:long-chain acyl-CoA synthetase
VTSNIAQEFVASAIATPLARAVSARGVALSYGELLTRVLAVGAHFRRRAPEGSRLLIVSKNSLEYVVAYYAALTARHVTVEIGAGEGIETLRKVAEETSPWAILTDVPALARELGLREIDAEELADDVPPVEDALREMEQTDTGDVASIVYTSGTTGTPKGVVLSHGNFLAVAASIQGYLGLVPSDRSLLLLPLCHTYGKSVLLTSLRVGASVHLFGEFENLPVLLGTLQEDRITILNLVPFHIAAILRWGDLRGRDLSAMSKVTVSGSPIPADRLLEFAARFPHAEVFFMFGLTESCTRACYLPPRDLERKPGSVGIPIQGVSVRIRSEDGLDLPPGMDGEICLAGPNVMKGYFNDDELTRNTIRDGWLFTGDIGHLDDEGYLFITARKKDIIKCAGERISAREIEEVLESHPNVAEAAVRGLPDSVVGERVVAFVVEREPTWLETPLRDWCMHRLSHLKVPRIYRFLEQLPRTPSGKVLKHLLSLET